MQKIIAPWTRQEVINLNAWQKRGDVHPFTCQNGHTLVATNNGWRCPACLDYKQDWAWEIMVKEDKMSDEQELSPTARKLVHATEVLKNLTIQLDTLAREAGTKFQELQQTLKELDEDGKDGHDN